jgi:glycosyltransferase involved in cell wall biosynthesis
MNTPKVSVVIPTYNKARYLELSLASWCHQRFEDHELVIVDDGSTDSTQDVLRKFTGRLPIHCVNGDHSGRAATRNKGLQACRGSLVIFVDDDRIVPADFVAAHVNAHDSHPGPLVVLGWEYDLLVDLPVVADHSLPLRMVMRLLQERPKLQEQLSLGARAAVINAEDLADGISATLPFRLPSLWQTKTNTLTAMYGEDISDCPLAWICGMTGNMSTRRELLEQVGGFDEAFRGWGLEDAELHYRLVRHGARTRVVKAACNFHQNHPRSVQSQIWNWFRNAQIMLAKHETMEVAMLIQTWATNTPLIDACRILTEVRSLGETPLVKAYRRLLINQAYELVSHAEMSPDEDVKERKAAALQG